MKTPSLKVKIQWHGLVLRCLVVVVLSPLLVITVIGYYLGALGTGSFDLFRAALKWSDPYLPASRRLIPLD